MRNFRQTYLNSPWVALLLWFVFVGATIKSGATTDVLTVDPTSKAARVTIYDSAGREVSRQGKQTYSASNTFTPPATPTDMFKITGSGTKTIRVVSLRWTTTNTAAGSQQFFVIRRSADDTTGTFVANPLIAKLDSSDGAATAVVGHYTANPGGLGATAGTIATTRVASPAAVPASFAGVMQETTIELLPWNAAQTLDQPVTLRGAAEILAVNFNGAALVAGQTHAYTVVWTEE